MVTNVLHFLFAFLDIFAPNPSDLILLTCLRPDANEMILLVPVDTIEQACAIFSFALAFGLAFGLGLGLPFGIGLGLGLPLGLGLGRGPALWR